MTNSLGCIWFRRSSHHDPRATLSAWVIPKATGKPSPRDTSAVCSCVSTVPPIYLHLLLKTLHDALHSQLAADDNRVINVLDRTMRWSWVPADRLATKAFHYPPSRVTETVNSLRDLENSACEIYSFDSAISQPWEREKSLIIIWFLIHIPRRYSRYLAIVKWYLLYF